MDLVGKRGKLVSDVYTIGWVCKGLGMTLIERGKRDKRGRTGWSYLV